MSNSELLECCVCTSKFDAEATQPHCPKMLSCGHSLCSECSSNPLMLQRAPGTFVVPCPTCRRPTDVKNLANNYALMDVIRTHASKSSVPVGKVGANCEECAKVPAVPATFFCSDCRYAYVVWTHIFICVRLYFYYVLTSPRHTLRAIHTVVPSISLRFDPVCNGLTDLPVLYCVRTVIPTFINPTSGKPISEYR